MPFVMFNDRLPSSAATVTSVLVFAVFLSLRALAPEGALDTPVARAQSYANIAIPFLALGLISTYFRLASTSAERRMEKIAETDPLTGLLNRRRMSERLAEEHARCAASGAAPFALIIADVDHFKQINDTHGHAIGDRVLQNAVTACRQNLRQGDVFGRLGGEEFGILLPDCIAATAFDRAENLRKAIAAIPVEADGSHVAISASFGVSSTERAGHDLQRLLVDADHALYRAKHSGRNRVESGGAGDSIMPTAPAEVSKRKADPDLSNASTLAEPASRACRFGQSGQNATVKLIRAA
jgi:diguanylate cyclase (GGDEF)-like protein